ncbi:jg11213 [Pararge aegeria aegeria]|uniref:Jg11213 protein n=1 Tax=Pararge aegeria aegeria TaxID=348720 RepID=A0A8S4RKW9_9NEOP|nr:jg11213 [Pararge aegeria aegeria]
MEVDERSQGASWRWSVLFSVIVLNVCLPSLILSYGVIWVYISNFEVPLWLGLAAPSIFVLTFGFTQCWFREAADSWGGSNGYRVMATIGLGFVVTGLLICAFVSVQYQLLAYGVLGGLGSSLISAQVDAVMFETYDTRLELVRGMCYTGQAIGQSLFPHILFFLIEYYGYAFSYIILGGIMLQTLPVILLLKVDDPRRSAYFTRYKELSQTFLVYRNEIDQVYGTEVQLHNLSKKCWKSPSDDNLHRLGDSDYDNSKIDETITPPPSPEEKRRNIFGVEILPEIPEETEDSDTDEESDGETNLNKSKKRFSLAIKRLSTIGDNFDECIENQVRRDSQSNGDIVENKEYSELEVRYDTIAPNTDIQTEKLLNTFNFRCQSAYVNIKRKITIPSYRVYRIRRRMLYLMYNINDTFLKPLRRSLSCGRFYPAVLLSFTKLTLMTVGIILLPMIGLQIRPKIAMYETNFLMSLHGFTWICFLLCTPWLAHTPKRNFKYVVAFGLVISTCACFVLAEANNHDSFAIGCVIAGFGYGAITSCWESTVQEFVGARKWPKLHSTIETVSATLLVVLVVGLSFVVGKDNGLQFAMFILGLITAVVSFIWIIITGVSIYKTKVRTLSFKRKWTF